MSSFEFMQNPIVPGQYNNTPMQYQQPQYQPQYQQPAQYIEPAPIFQNTSSMGVSFSVIADDDTPSKALALPSPNSVDPSDIGLNNRKKSGRRKSESNDAPRVEGTEIIRAEGTVEELPTMYSYAETTNMTRQTIQQLDCLASEIKDELDNIRMSRSLKRRNDYIIGLSANLGSLLGTKLSAVRDITNTISKANEMDYKREKDRRVSETNQNDDKYLMDLYQAFITNPGNNPNQVGILGPSGVASTVNSADIVRVPLAGQQNTPNGNLMDAGYLNYMSNMTPEQRMMILEHDPNVKQVVVFDAATGNKFFQVMNMNTGQVVTGVPVRDQMFMEDTTLDIRNKIAKNINLNETYPIVVINEDIAKEY